MNQDQTPTYRYQGLAADGLSFGDVHAELAAARDSAVVAPLVDHGVIRASGPEAGEFLHRLMTNDIQGIGARDARFAGMCTAKGRLLALFLFWRDGDDYLLMMPRDILGGILKKLTMYVLRAKVKLADATNEFALFGYASPAAPAGELAGLDALARFGNAILPQGWAIRLDGHRWIVAARAEHGDSTWRQLAEAARPVGTSSWQWLEIAAGQPRVVAATQEAFVPQMLNMELPAVGGVSFTKGCYPGQEIVARTQYLGKVKRRMFRARLASQPAQGTHVYAPETGAQHCGEIVSSAPAPGGGFEVLVCVQIGAREAGDVRVGGPDGPRLEFLALPYPVVEDSPAVS